MAELNWALEELDRDLMDWRRRCIQDSRPDIVASREIITLGEEVPTAIVSARAGSVRPEGIRAQFSSTTFGVTRLPEQDGEARFCLSLRDDLPLAHPEIIETLDLVALNANGARVLVRVQAKAPREPWQAAASPPARRASFPWLHVLVASAVATPIALGITVALIRFLS